MNYSDSGLKVENAGVKLLDFIPVPYPEGDYKIEVHTVDDYITETQKFKLPERIIIHDKIDENGKLTGTITTLKSMYMDFYLPYSEKGKEIVIYDDKNNAINKIDISLFSKLTNEERNAILQSKIKKESALKSQQILIPLLLLVLIIIIGSYLLYKEKQK